MVGFPKFVNKVVGRSEILKVIVGGVRRRLRKEISIFWTWGLLKTSINLTQCPKRQIYNSWSRFVYKAQW